MRCNGLDQITQITRSPPGQHFDQYTKKTVNKVFTHWEPRAKDSVFIFITGIYKPGFYVKELRAGQFHA